MPPPRLSLALLWLWPRMGEWVHEGLHGRGGGSGGGRGWARKGLLAFHVRHVSGHFQQRGQQVLERRHTADRGREGADEREGHGGERGRGGLLLRHGGGAHAVGIAAHCNAAGHLALNLEDVQEDQPDHRPHHSTEHGRRHSQTGAANRQGLGGFHSERGRGGVGEHGERQELGDAPVVACGCHAEDRYNSMAERKEHQRRKVLQQNFALLENPKRHGDDRGTQQGHDSIAGSQRHGELDSGAEVLQTFDIRHAFHHPHSGNGTHRHEACHDHRLNNRAQSPAQ
mmetsp:Transcript_89287/g.148369  ORF Transcript_89287/g.148369 Transcript_89287/m.148369 type:complete len:284 (+) Transcript_89287:594-1445(+)